MSTKESFFSPELQEIASYARVLSHPARLAILVYLSQQKSCISGDIAEELPLGRTTVSQHLKVLKEAGLIKGTIDGRSICYCIDVEKVIRLHQLFNSYFAPIERTATNRCETADNVLRHLKILILCTGNSCRSQMAEAFLKSFNPVWEIYSAGTRPAESVHPKAIAAMDELGIELSQNRPEPVDKYTDSDFDYVITVCGGAKENCPVFNGNVKHHLHIGFDDPADATGSEEQIMEVFRRVRDEIKSHFYELYTKIKKHD